MTDALAGIVALDLSESIAGQYCTRMLADFGADVTLIEPPTGSRLRRVGPYDASGASLLFFHLNLGKRSVTLGPTASLHALARTADVIVVPPGVDRAALRAENPNAIITLVSGFGERGSLSDWRGGEMIYQALSGMMNHNGEADREPLYGCGDRASYAAGVAAYISTLGALFARRRIGRGQDVSAEVLETACAMSYPFQTQYIYNRSLEPRGDQRQPLGLVRMRDGWVIFWIYDDRWPAACRALGVPALIDDPRFANPKDRIDNWAEFTATIERESGDQSAEDVVARLQAGRVAGAKAYRLSELGDGCAHLKARGFWESVPTPTGPRTILGPQFRLAATPRHVRGAAPEIGQDNAAIGATDGAFAAPRRLDVTTGKAPPLAGIRVLDMTTAWAGPMAAKFLGFLGAEVIHVESASRLNVWRHYRHVINPRRYPDGDPGERQYNRISLFNSQNTDKLSLTLDLKRPGGLETLLKLAAVSDVVMSNFTVGTMRRLGLDYERLRAVRPDIIAVEMPPYGNSGPMAQYTALGPMMEMVTGMASMIGYPGGPPTPTGPSYPDPIGGMNATAAVLTALLHRASTGEGQYVEVPQCEAAMHFIGEHVLHALETGEDPTPDGNRVPWAAPHDVFPTRGDDEWVAIAVTDDAEWHALCRTIGLPNLAGEARFATIPARVRNHAVLRVPIADWSTRRSKQEAAALLQQAGVPAAPVQKACDVVESPYLAERGYFTVLDHAEAGRHAYPGAPFHFSETPTGLRRAAPCLGEHTREILTDILRLSAVEIAELEAAGTIRSEPD